MLASVEARFDKSLTEDLTATSCGWLWTYGPEAYLLRVAFAVRGPGDADLRWLPTLGSGSWAA